MNKYTILFTTGDSSSTQVATLSEIDSDMAEARFLKFVPTATVLTVTEGHDVEAAFNMNRNGELV